MSMLRLAAAVVVSFGLAAPAMAQDIEDYLDIPGPITFEGTDFELAWTSHPAPAYYKQEYVPAGQVVEAYVEMFMIDVLTEGQDPESAAAGMIAGLDERKANGDPVINYDMISNEATGELILDFLISDTSSGEIIVEWNAYRYSPTADGSGLTLFAISRRGYGEDGATQFLEGLTSWRETSIQELAVMDLPPVTIVAD
ncbi:hypothetical protein [Devosia sp. SL43]|uniref:hypothetical protein n=1 Tax=Devosia sp. SL43 TaxID=2806348 RepID=UPI001F48F32C|nr:hypothetical protein [Devosia sp. SL43]UJW86350.1 hypothetical protein IM737_03495 [Devosia sp. SL43]